MTETALPYTPEEFIAVLISREVRDFETVGVGAVSPIPSAGCILAEKLHAPHATIIILGSKEYYPFPFGGSEIHFLAQRGEMDLFFLSGLQFDRHGNLNLHVIGDYHSPKLRLPGAYGSAVLYYMAHRVILFRTEHTRRTFVDQVDFITAPGVTPESVYREGGPTKVITPKAVMTWDRKDKEWILTGVNPGSSIEDIKENTGFDLRISPALEMTLPPTKQELLALRTAVAEKLRRIYPDFVDQKILTLKKR